MSLFSIGLSGLGAAQIALQTTGSNISNLTTPGYNRQLALFGEAHVGSGGVQINDVQRQFNQYIATQLNNANGTTKALEAYANQISQIDNLLADREAGLAPLIQNFFSSLEDLASAPSDPASRQGVIGTANSLSAQFRSFDNYLDEMQQGINSQIRDEVTQINNTAKQIANINREISLARAKTGEAPNSLLNQRDKLVADLSERLDVKLHIQDGKTYNLTIANGQPLVSGNRSFSLEAVASSTDPSRFVVAYNDPAGNQIELPETTFDKGTLGGLMTFRRESLDSTQNQLGQLALSLAEGFNAQHRLGQDLNGEQGKDFFSVGSPTVFSNQNNDGTAVISAEFSDISAVTASDYDIRFDGTDYTVTRLDTGTVAFDGPLDANDSMTFDGLTLTVTDPVNAQAGDRFQLQPTRNLAGQFENLIRDTAEIAAGALTKVEAGEDNTGSLAVGQISAEQGYTLSEAEINLTVSGVAGTAFTLDGFDAGATVSINGGAPVANPGGGVTLNEGDTITVDGVTFTLEGMPADGDTLTIGEYEPASGDNRNALALQGLQSEDLVGGRASFNEAYASLVSDVGNRTNVTEVNLEVQQGLSDQLFAVQQSESGVNFNEEAANLILYQQYYQANAKVIDTATTIFDTILGLRG